MSQPLLLLLFGSLCFLLLAGSLLLMPHLRRHEGMRARLQQVRLDGQASAPITRPSGPLLVRFVAAVGAWLGRSSFVQARLAGGMRATLLQAGFRSQHAFSLFLGSKALLILTLPLTAYVLIPSDVPSLRRNFVLLIAVVVGMMGPEFFIKRRRKQYIAALEVGLSDALDLMVICVESGLALEPAVERVGQEIKAAHPQVALEFELTTNELRVVADRRVAILNLGQRTGLEPLKRLSTTLVQTLQYGTPLASALRVLSAELRGETMIRFEAKAAKLPVLLTIPMILFILPCLFLVVGGPAIVQVRAMMHG